MPTMELEYSLDEEDILAFTRYRAQTMGQRQHRIRQQRILYSICFLMLALGSLLLHLPVLAAIFLLMVPLAIFVYPALWEWRIERAVHSAYQDEKRRATLGPRTLRATEAALVESSPLGEVRLPWEQIDRVHTQPGCAYVWAGGFPVLIIAEHRVIAGDYSAFVGACRELHDKALERQESMPGSQDTSGAEDGQVEASGQAPP